MAELLEGLIRGFVALLQLIVEVSALLAEAAVTLIAYLWSQGFRDRKEAEWRGRRVRKFVHLGLSGVCLVALVATPAWLVLHKPVPGTEVKLKRLEAETPEKGEELRLSVNATNNLGREYESRIAIREGGTSKILGSKTRKDLKDHIKENVVRIDDRKESEQPGQ